MDRNNNTGCKIKKFNKRGILQNATSIKTFLKSQLVFLLGSRITPMKNRYIVLITHTIIPVIITPLSVGPSIKPKLKFLLI